MKKVIITGLVSVALSATLAEAKFFVGVEGEYGMSSIYTTPFASQGTVSWGNRGFDGGPWYPYYQEWGVGINIGTEHFFNNYVGFRWLFGIGYGQIFYPSWFIDYQQIALQLGVDGLFNIINTGSFSLGLFAGLGFRTDFIAENFFVRLGSIHGNLLGRVGFTLGFGEHNRIDIGVGIPFMTVAISNNAFMHAPIRFNIGYKFLF